ncbi:unknown [Firmicutes bacterium CAG:449]|nr:unknown [Firmicutes bacterium CAG:449]
MNLLSQVSVPCQKISAKTHKEKQTATISVTVLLESTEKMQDLFNNIINIEGVYEVKRVTK